MKRHTAISAIVIAALLAFVATPAKSTPAADGTSVKVSLDSTYLLMGRTTPLHIEIITPQGASGYLHASGDTLMEGVEIASRSKADTVDLGNGRLQIRQDLVLQSFDSGDYTLPPILLIRGNDTIRSNRVALKVTPAPIDTLQSIHDYADVVTIKAHFWDWVPSWISDNWGLILAIILLLGGAAAWYFLYYRKKAKGKPAFALRPAPKPVPPYELAIKRLEVLHGEKLWENGQEKEFYTRLTDILREYIDSRFHINAMEMTSAQILRALRNNEDTRLPEVYMRQILQIADYVKFAKMRPFSEDNVKAYADAVKFVEDTKPRPEPTAETGAVTDNNNVSSTDNK